MTYSESRYREIEDEFYSSTRDFCGEHENDELARTLFITTEELARIHQDVVAEYGDEATGRHQYQDIFFSKSVDSLFALHRLVKHYWYDAGYREVRFLLESYFVVRGLNRDKENAEAIYETYKTEIEALVGSDDPMEVALHEFEATDQLFDVWRDEREACEEVWPRVRRFYNYVSNRSTHPVRMIGAWEDGSWSGSEERELLTWGLYISYGLGKELLKTYQDTSAAEFIEQESQPVVEQFDEVLGNDVPTFLLEIY
jgi:hypothetical protein